MTREPRLLNSGLSEVARLLPSAMSVSLEFEGVSSASMTLPEDQHAVAIHDWVEVFTPGGSAGIFRATNIDDTKRKERVVTLMHAIDTLSGSVWHGSEDYDGTVAAFVAKLMSMQAVAYWQLGTCEDSGAWLRSGINYERLSDLLEEVREARTDYYFEYDFSTTPWTLNIRAKSNAITSEFRLARNVESCRITRSDSEMCNKLYLSVSHRKKTEVTEDDDLVTTETQIKVYENTTSQSTYGIIERTADIDLEDVPSADAWAAAFLAQRATPAVQITIDGYALKQITGEEWDEAKLGQMARVAMPDYGETLEERVVTLNYPELLFGEGAERVTVELANHLPKFSESIANTAKETKKNSRAGRGAARGSGAGSGVLENWSIITQKYSDILDTTGVRVLYESGIEVDAQAGITLYSLQQGFTSQYAGIKLNSAAITSEVQRATAAEGTLSSSITQTASDITAEVTRAQGAENELSGRISVQAGRIDLVVQGSGSSASIKIQAITDGINNAGSSVTISADKIYLDSSTNVKSLLTGNAVASKIVANTLEVFPSGTLLLNSYSHFLIHGSEADWKEDSVLTDVTFPSTGLSKRRYFVYSDSISVSDISDLHTVYGYLVTSHSTGSKTTQSLKYLGR